MRYLILITIILSSCYTRPVANKQHGRAIATFPDIGAEFCARIYPCDTTGTKSDTVTVLDTLWTDPEIEILYDTTTVNDTIRIVKTLPAITKVVTKTVTIRDTIRIKDQADLDACNIEKSKVIQLANDQTAERKKYQKRATKWTIAAIIMGSLILLWLFLAIRKRVIAK